MKVKILSLTMALTLAGVLLTALALSQSSEPAYSTPLEITPPPSVLLEDTEAEGFWVCALDETVAVYHNFDRDVPIETTEITLRTLRYADQDMLREGVFFADYMDVVQFLEDFCP